MINKVDREKIAEIYIDSEEDVVMDLFIDIKTTEEEEEEIRGRLMGLIDVLSVASKRAIEEEEKLDE